MDSVSQAALGATVGVVVMGRSIPVWRAALAGALVGTLPDLDVFIDQGDEIRNMVLHRAETHALFWQALATPLIALVLAMMTRTREHLTRWCLMVLLGLVTHALLDAMTVYGTRLWLPFNDDPVGIGSLFIIDPLYTLPLLLGLLLALVIRGGTRRRWATAGLALSTLYAGWSIAAQHHVSARVLASPEATGLSPQQVLVTPTPFNTVLWRILLMDRDSYREGFYSLLDPYVAPGRPIRFTRHDRGSRHEEATAAFAGANLVREFSRGFYALSDDGRYAYVTDLRMGQHPFFAFSFAFAEHQSHPLRAIDPIRVTRRMPFDAGMAWLRQRALGHEAAPPQLDASRYDRRP
ncbi:MAG: metal-dependent hydrolase [Gammaproteobacteria bacterium]|nr:metal-dependent hydrolase [Gammaproteobacteria bacterium]